MLPLFIRNIFSDWYCSNSERIAQNGKG